MAVEIDVEAFEQSVKDDEALQNLAAETYYYSDGSSTSDHIKDKELYELALAWMKASGNFNYNTLYMKPALWARAIQDFHQQQSYSLTDVKGVDIRLIRMAKAQNKTILNIETAESKITLDTGWSDSLQELLLSEAVTTTGKAYSSAVQELYESWCIGDESALTEAIKDEFSDMTVEDQKLYSEYNQAMMTDRNALMLKAAKKYLESGETVFYAVGLAHLLAEDGLVNALRNAGYTVEPVVFQ